MSVSALRGLRLESCRFSRSTYTFEFCGKVDGNYKAWHVSTSYCFSDQVNNPSDACEDFSRQAWSFLEKKLQDVQLDREQGTSKATFTFCDGSKFFVWADEPQSDNLLIVSELQTKTEAWFVEG